jgi:hypothetical protein
MNEKNLSFVVIANNRSIKENIMIENYTAKEQ